MEGGVDQTQKEQPAQGAFVRDSGVNLPNPAEDRHGRSGQKETNAGKEYLAAEISAVNLEFLIAQLDQRISHGPADHDKHSQKYFKPVIFQNGFVHFVFNLLYKQGVL